MFWQSIQGRQQQFKKESLAQDMTSLYLCVYVWLDVGMAIGRSFIVIIFIAI